MIVAFSTSAPVVSVAVFTPTGRLMAYDRREAGRRAGEACLLMLEALRAHAGESPWYVADVGPGGFTGVKVGVTLAKTLAFTEGVRVAGVASFDLIARERTVAVPIQRGKFLVRVPGEAPYESTEPAEDAMGYGLRREDVAYPDASRLGPLIPHLTWVPPGQLVPSYLSMPGISSPKRPYGQARAGG